ncbi:hypothetical protein [Cryobacterium sp. CG_9.6]|uniref:hypothetical protein n=1 Tax=Cryobacterium sp. CG_9.6 TaxID=2760710 RepID=UPI0024762266|nr:hypothetical protein [Cryobacterium sp. CG_9.6]MDH6236967.1 putative membrane protein [Cryobacterium sp. CG_9.6]
MKIVPYVIAMAIFVLGMFLFGLAFTVTVFQGAIFIAGILAIALSLAIPFHFLRN